MITLPYNQLYRFIENIMVSFEASSYETLDYYLLKYYTHYTISDLDGLDVRLVLKCNEDYIPVLIIGSSEYVLEEFYQSLSSLKTSALGYKSVQEFLQYGDYSIFHFYLHPPRTAPLLTRLERACDTETLTVGCVRNAGIGSEVVTIVELPELNNLG